MPPLFYEIIKSFRSEQWPNFHNIPRFHERNFNYVILNAGTMYFTWKIFQFEARKKTSREKIFQFHVRKWVSLVWIFREELKGYHLLTDVRPQPSLISHVFLSLKDQDISIICTNDLPVTPKSGLIVKSNLALTQIPQEGNIHLRDEIAHWWLSRAWWQSLTSFETGDSSPRMPA